MALHFRPGTDAEHRALVQIFEHRVAHQLHDAAIRAAGDDPRVGLLRHLGERLLERCLDALVDDEVLGAASDAQDGPCHGQFPFFSDSIFEVNSVCVSFDFNKLKR